MGLPSEHEGIVPSTTWKLKFRNEPWIAGETISASIGQGYVTVHSDPDGTSPSLRLPMMEWRFAPALSKELWRVALGQLQELSSVPRWELNLNPETLKLIKASLVRVVKEGTGVRANSSLVLIAGRLEPHKPLHFRKVRKRTSPELRDHAWFVSYAPAESPEIAVAVLVEHMGHGGSAAAPLARQLIERYMMLKQEDGPGPGRSRRSPLTAWATRGGL